MAQDLLARLKQIETEILPDLLSRPDNVWNTVDVIYHPPHVERCWMQLDDVRLFLHCIHPHDNAADCLWHPHDWPSAMKIVRGCYAHDVGWSSPARAGLVRPDEWLAHEEMAAGTYYEMTNPFAWHRVRPLQQEAYTIMVAGEPYSRKVTFPKPREKQPPLTPERRQHVLHLFRSLYLPEYAARMDGTSYG